MISTSIKNRQIQITVSDLGAELTSIKTLDDGVEMLWQGDGNYFSWQSPLLFPIIGGLKEDSYIYEDRKYHMPFHGFAKDSLFELCEKNDSRLKYKLKYNYDTLKSYPFEFELHQEYEIIRNSINITYCVYNLGKNKMFFSIGAHPAFNCPIITNEEMSDYFLEFEHGESMETYYKKGDAVSVDTKKIAGSGKIINLSHELFLGGPIIFKKINSDYVMLKSKKSGKSVKIDFKRFPYLGIWSSKNEGHFVCIEPWYGLGDVEGNSNEIREKEGIVSLEPKNIFKAGYTITVN